MTSDNRIILAFIHIRVVCTFSALTCQNCSACPTCGMACWPFSSPWRSVSLPVFPHVTMITHRRSEVLLLFDYYDYYWCCLYRYLQLSFFEQRCIHSFQLNGQVSFWYNMNTFRPHTRGRLGTFDINKDMQCEITPIVIRNVVHRYSWFHKYLVWFAPRNFVIYTTTNSNNP